MRRTSRRALRAELDPETTKGKAGPLAESLARQRLDPLKGHLAGVRRLIVVNSPGLAGVPVEVLLAARPDPAWDAITVSYAPSASMFAYLVGRPVPRDRPATLLAVADPAYPEPKDDAPAPAPPGSGLAVARVRAQRQRRPQRPPRGRHPPELRRDRVEASRRPQAGRLRRRAEEGAGEILARGDHPRGRGRRRAAGRRHRPPAGVGVRPRPPRVRAGPARDARRVARPAARHPPRGRGRRRALPRRGKPPPSSAPRRARRPCRAWPARGSSRATATSTSPPTASRTRASPTARR